MPPFRSLRKTARLAALLALAMTAPADARPRAREQGVSIGVLPTGPLNAITDVAGVRVGHVTLIEGANVRTGVTAILPHGGNLYQDKVPAGFVGRQRLWQVHRLDPDRRAGRDRDADPAHQHLVGARRDAGHRRLDAGPARQ